MADQRGRTPFARLQANTTAKEGSAVSPPAKAPVNRASGPALQAGSEGLAPERLGRPALRKSRFAPTSQAAASAAAPAAAEAEAGAVQRQEQPSAAPAEGPQLTPPPQQQPAALLHQKQQRQVRFVAPAGHADTAASQQQAPPAGLVPAAQPQQQGQQRQVRFVAPPSKLPSPPAVPAAEATPPFAGFQSRLPRLKATPAAANTASGKAASAADSSAATAAAAPEAVADTPPLLLWQPDGGAAMAAAVTPQVQLQQHSSGQQQSGSRLSTPGFALSTQVPSSAASGGTQSSGWSTEETPPFVGQMRPSRIPRFGITPGSRQWFEETPEEPKPLDVSLDAALESPDAAAARQFATSAAADSLALSGVVLSAGDAASAPPTNPEAAAAQLEAWREADKYLVDNPLADKAAAERAAVAAPTEPQTPALLASGSLGNSGGQQASPAAALGLFDLEEFSFGAPPASYRDSTPGLLMDQSLAVPTTMQDVEAWCAINSSPCASTARFPVAAHGSPPPRLRLSPATPRFLPSAGLLATDAAEATLPPDSDGNVTVISLASPATESVDSCSGGNVGRGGRFGTPPGFVLPTLKELTGRGSDSPLTAVSHWSPSSSGGRHMRSASAAASLGGIAAGMVRLTPPVTVDQQAVDPLCASPDQDPQVHDSPESANDRPQQLPPPTASAAKPYLSMLRHLRGSSYDSPNLGGQQDQQDHDSPPGTSAVARAAAEDGSEVDSPFTPKTQSAAGSRLHAGSPATSDSSPAASDDSPGHASAGSPANMSDSSPPASDGGLADGGAAIDVATDGVATAAADAPSATAAADKNAAPAAVPMADPPASPGSPADAAQPAAAAQAAVADEAAVLGDAGATAGFNGGLATEGAGLAAGTPAGAPTAVQGGDATPGRGSLETWMAATGLTDITTPAQRGLQAMWGAAGEVRALRSLVKRVAASELEIAAAEADEAASHWAAMVEHAEAVAHDNEALRAELDRVRAELEATVARSRQEAEAANLQLAQLSAQSEAMAAERQAEVEALHAELEAARLRLSQAETAAGAGASATTTEDASSRDDSRASLEAELQRARLEVEEAHKAANAAAVDAASRATAMEAQLEAAAAAAADAQRRAAEAADAQQPALPQPAAAASPEPPAADSTPAAAGLVTHADENASLRAQLAAALLQLAVATPLQHAPADHPAGAMVLHSPPRSSVRRLSLLGGFTPSRGDGFDSDYEGYVTAGEQEWDACSEEDEAAVAALSAAKETTVSEPDATAAAQATVDCATAAAAEAALDHEAAAAWLGGECDAAALPSPMPQGSALAAPAAAGDELQPAVEEAEAAGSPSASSPAASTASLSCQEEVTMSPPPEGPAMDPEAASTAASSPKTATTAPPCSPAASAAVTPGSSTDAALSPAQSAACSLMANIQPEADAVSSADTIAASPEAPESTATEAATASPQVPSPACQAPAAGSGLQAADPKGSAVVTPSPAARTPSAAAAADELPATSTLSWPASPSQLTAHSPATVPSLTANSLGSHTAELADGSVMTWPTSPAPIASPMTTDTAAAGTGPWSPAQASPEVVSPATTSADAAAADTPECAGVNTGGSSGGGSPSSRGSIGVPPFRLPDSPDSVCSSSIGAGSIDSGNYPASSQLAASTAAEVVPATPASVSSGASAGCEDESPCSGGANTCPPLPEAAADTTTDMPATPANNPNGASPGSRGDSSLDSMTGSMLRPLPEAAADTAADVPATPASISTADQGLISDSAALPLAQMDAAEAAASEQRSTAPVSPAGADLDAATAAGSLFAATTAAASLTMLSPESPDGATQCELAPTATTPWSFVPPTPPLPQQVAAAGDATADSFSQSVLQGEPTTAAAAASASAAPLTPGIPAVLPLSPGCTPVLPVAATAADGAPTAGVAAIDEEAAASQTDELTSSMAVASSPAASAAGSAGTSSAMPPAAEDAEVPTWSAAASPAASCPGTPTPATEPLPQAPLPGEPSILVAQPVAQPQPASPAAASPPAAEAPPSPPEAAAPARSPTASVPGSPTSPSAASSVATSPPASPAAAVSLGVPSPAASAASPSAHGSPASPMSTSPAASLVGSPSSCVGTPPPAGGPRGRSRSITASPGDIIRKGGVLGAIRHFDQRGFGAVPPPPRHIVLSLAAPPPKKLLRAPPPAAAMVAAPSATPAAATPVASSAPPTGEADEALTPVSALAAILPQRSGHVAAADPTPSQPPAAAAAPGATAGGSGGGAPAADGGQGSPLMAHGRPAAGWGGITARLQRLRAELRETQARLHTAEQMNFGSTPSSVSAACAAVPGTNPCSNASLGNLDPTASDDYINAVDNLAPSNTADDCSDVGSPFGSVIGSHCKSMFDVTGSMCGGGGASSISLVIPGSIVAADSPPCSGVSLADSSATPGGDFSAEEVDGTAAVDADFGSPNAELHLQGLGSPIDESSPDRSPSPVAGLIESPIFPPSPSITSPLRGCFSAQGGLGGSPLAGLPPTAGSAVRRTFSASAAAEANAAAADAVEITGGGAWQFAAAATGSAEGGAGFSPAVLNPGGGLNPAAADDVDAASEAGSSCGSSAGAAPGFSSGSSGASTGGQMRRRRRRRRVAQSLTFAPPSPGGSTGSQEGSEAAAQLVAWAAARVRPLAALAAAAAGATPDKPPTFDLSAAAAAAPVCELPATPGAAAEDPEEAGSSGGCTPWPPVRPRSPPPFTVGRSPPRLVDYDTDATEEE